MGPRVRCPGEHRRVRSYRDQADGQQGGGRVRGGGRAEGGARDPREAEGGRCRGGAVRRYPTETARDGHRGGERRAGGCVTVELVYQRADYQRDGREEYVAGWQGRLDVKCDNRI